MEQSTFFGLISFRYGNELLGYGFFVFDDRNSVFCHIEQYVYVEQKYFNTLFGQFVKALAIFVIDDADFVIWKALTQKRIYIFYEFNPFGDKTG